MYLNGSTKGGEKWLDSVNILNIELIGFIKNCSVRGRGIEDDFKDFGLSLAGWSYHLLDKGEGRIVEKFVFDILSLRCFLHLRGDVTQSDKSVEFRREV